MTIPAYSSKGTASDATWDSCLGAFSHSVTAPSVVDAGDILVYVINTRTLGTVDGFTAPTGFTTAYDSGTGANRHRYVGYKVAVGTEDSSSITATVSATSGGASIAQIYRFVNSGTGGYHAVGGNNSGTSTTPSFANVVTTVSNELAVGVVFIDNNTTAGDVTSETGGDWTEAAQDNSSGASAIQVQTAQMASAGTLSGGTLTLGTSSGWVTFSFALKEVVAATSSLIFGKPTMLAHHILR